MNYTKHQTGKWLVILSEADINTYIAKHND